MKKVENEKIVARLNSMYRVSRAGKPVRGIERKEKEWYSNTEVGRYQLCVKESQVPIYTIPFKDV